MSYSGRRTAEFVELKKGSKVYLDVSLSFTPSPINNDITLLKNERAINNAIKNIIMILPSEVPFDAEMGSTTLRYLFDVIDDATAGLLATEIRRAILFCEPRVTFRSANPDETYDLDLRAYEASAIADRFYDDKLGVFVEAQPDQNQFAVTVKYRIVGDEKIFRVQEILTPTR